MVKPLLTWCDPVQHWWLTWSNPSWPGVTQFNTNGWRGQTPPDLTWTCSTLTVDVVKPLLTWCSPTQHHAFPGHSGHIVERCVLVCGRDVFENFQRSRPFTDLHGVKPVCSKRLDSNSLAVTRNVRMEANSFLGTENRLTPLWFYMVFDGSRTSSDTAQS